MTRRIIGIHEKLSVLESLPLSIQHLTAMFGATILVPILLGVDPAIALLMNGIGTLIYTVLTKGGIPAYLGSSFAFIAPTMLIIGSYGGFTHAQSGFIMFGYFFMLISLVVKFWGIKWIDIVMPPAVMGAVVAIIGLELAPIAAQQAGLAPWPTIVGQVVQPFVMDSNVVIVSMFTLLVGIAGSVFFKGFMQVIPILVAVVAGYILAMGMDMVDTAVIGNAAWFALPKFQAPIFDINAIIIIAPACIVVLAEHISHLIVTGKITETDLMKNPGLHRSLLGDGISNVISGFAGSPPNTTYGENIGVMAITRVYSVWVIRGAAILAIAFSLIGKVSAAISTIPTPVMGGITMLLYGVIAVQGFRMFVEHKVDFSKNSNMVLGAITFVVGVSGASINIGTVQLKGMAFAAIIGVMLSLIFWIFDKISKKGELLFEENSTLSMEGIKRELLVGEKSIISIEGRISRTTYWTRSLTVGVINWGLLFVSELSENYLVGITLTIVSLLLMIFLVIQSIKRMHDINNNGWYIFIPIYNLILWFGKGTKGDNKYGVDPKKE